MCRSRGHGTYVVCNITATHELAVTLPLDQVARGAFYLSVGVFSDDGTGLRVALDHYSRVMRIEVLGSPAWNTSAFGYMSLKGMTVRETSL